MSISSDTASVAWVLDAPGETPFIAISSHSDFSTWFSSAAGVVGQNSRTYSGLLSNVTYYFTVKVSTEADYAAAVSSATNPQRPYAPVWTGVGTSSVTVSWLAPNNAPGTQYRADAAINENSFAVFTPSTTQLNSATFEDLAPDNTYYVRVKALGLGGQDSDFLLFDSTATLANPPSDGVFSLVYSTAFSVIWSGNANPEWTSYRLDVSSSANFITAVSTLVASTYYEASGLLPNTTYYVKAWAVNIWGIDTAVYEFQPATVTAAAMPAEPVTLTAGENSVTAVWDAGNNPNDTQYYIYASTSADFIGTEYGPKTWAQSPTRIVTGLASDTLYHFRVKARNRQNWQTEYFGLGSATIPSGPDITPPAILLMQAGDETWRGDTSGNYAVYFEDISKVDRVLVRVSTGPEFTGTVIADWTEALTALNTVSYTTPWQLPEDIFNAIPENVTSYVSVMVYDMADTPNVAVSTDVFYVRRDTTVPTITGTPVLPAGWLDSDPGPIFSVNFADALSGLSRVYYSASDIANTANGNKIAWTEIAAFVSSASYSQPWGVNFAALGDGASNYISVMAQDNAGKSYIRKDVTRIMKNTVGPNAAILSPSGAVVSTVTAFSGTATAMNELSPVALVEISLRDLASATSEYYDGGGFNSAIPVWLAATGLGPWSFDAAAIPFVLDNEYQLTVRARDTVLWTQQPYPFRNFQISQALPTVTLSTPAAGATVYAFNLATGTATNGGGLAPLGAVNFYLKRLYDDQWWNFLTGAWGEARVASATVVTGADWSFTPGAVLRGNLTHNQQYFVTALALDTSEPPNASAYAAPGATFTFVDTIPPEPVTQFAASTGTSPGRINVTWTFPGDDGLGLPIPSGKYKIHYATYSEVAFSTQLAQVLISTGQVSAGQTQGYTITGLTPEVTYYLAMWVADDAELWSSSSTMAQTMSGENLNNQISGTVKTPCVTGDTCVNGFTGVTAVVLEAYSNTGALAATAYTLDDGLGSFILNSLPDGLYRVQATKVEEGFSSSIAKDQLPMGYSDVNFLLSLNYQLAGISGFVPASSPSGVRAAAAGGGSEVQLWQAGRKVYTVYADAAGRFAIRNLIPGQYTLKVMDAAGTWRSVEVKLVSGQMLQINPLSTLLKKDTVFAYPNPAVTNVTFRAVTDESSVRAQVSVYTVDGTLVRTAEGVVPGSKIYEDSWVFSSGKPASGVYFYTIKFRNEATGKVDTTTRKFAVIR